MNAASSSSLSSKRGGRGKRKSPEDISSVPKDKPKKARDTKAKTAQLEKREWPEYFNNVCHSSSLLHAMSLIYTC